MCCAEHRAFGLNTVYSINWIGNGTNLANDFEQIWFEYFPCTQLWKIWWSIKIMIYPYIYIYGLKKKDDHFQAVSVSTRTVLRLNTFGQVWRRLFSRTSSRMSVFPFRWWWWRWWWVLSWGCIKCWWLGFSWWWQNSVSYGGDGDGDWWG